MVKLFINNDFLVYYVSFFQTKLGDANFIPEFDFNHDGIIDMKDVSVVGEAYGTWLEIASPIKLLINDPWLHYYTYYFTAKKGDARYQPELDVNHDNVINMIDIAILARISGYWYTFG